jgi:NitT/TauT family transport system permease protein
MKSLFKNKNIKTILFLLFLLAIWEIVVSLKIFSPLLFPSLHSIAESLFKEIVNGEILIKSGYSLYLIFIGIVISLFGAMILTALSSFSRNIRDLVESIVALVDPLPGIALLPLAILWFGIGEAAIIFVIVHSVLWPILLNIMAGFRSVPSIYTEIGRNIGLSKSRLVIGIFLPASLPNILVGLRTGWSRAWRAFISAEMVFGTTGLSSGLGWHIFMKRSFMDTPGLYATLVVIMAISLLIEEVLFKVLETKTVKKWGMIQ